MECGECGGDGQIGGIQDLDAVIIERDQLKVENARWQKNYEHLIEQHMPRTGHGCEEGWSRVVEARELQAENAELVNLMRRVVAEHPRRNHKNDGNGPGHGHRVPGVWDEDNGELAGKPCAWCSIWSAAKGIVERHDRAMTKEQT